MHLSIDGGNINIESQDDGINTNEDGVSVTQINDGNLHIVAGLGSEGDGIDSNGYLVINGGTVIALAKPASDSGMDSDCGTLVNGGTVVALGSAMDDASDESNQGVMNLKFSASQKADSSIVVKDSDGKVVFAYDLSKDKATGDKARSYAGAIVSAKGIEVGKTYHVYTGGEISGTNVNGLYTADINHEGGTQLSYNGNSYAGGPGGMEFDKDGRPLQKPDDAPEIPNGPQADGKDGPPALPEGEQGAPNGANGEPPALPEGDLGDTSQPTPPAGGKPGQGGNGGNLDSSTVSYDFLMIDTATTFANVSTAVPGETTETAYKDVAADAWYYEAVQYVTAEKLMNGSGDGLFAPNDDITRGMIVTILWRMAGSPTVENDCAFTDLSQDWYRDAVKWAAACGIVKGYSDTQFAPDKSITREEMAAILYRYTEFKGEDTSADADLSQYKDATKISDYAQTCMKWAVGKGLINGETADTLAPQGTATRAQAAQILMRYCQ